MTNLKERRGNVCLMFTGAVFVTLLAAALLLSTGHYLWAADEQGLPPDKAGKEALRLWTEREMDRSIAEAARRYWDYWMRKPTRPYSSYRMWYELEETQKWLKDPEHQPLPPPPPTGPWTPPPYPSYPYPYSYPYSYPYPYYYPPSYSPVPPMWLPPPYYPNPETPKSPGE